MPFGPLFGVSIVAGLAGALSGMGGGVVLIPVLTLFGVDIKHTIAISNLSVIAVSSSAAPGYVRRHMPNFTAVAFLELFAAVGAFFGALLTLASGQRLLFVLCGVVLLASCAVLWRQRRGSTTLPAQQGPCSRWLRLAGSYYDHVEQRTIAYQGHRAALGALLMTAAGAVSGLLGIGGSAMTVLILELVLGFPPKVSLTTSNLIIGVVALAGANVYLEAGLINLSLAVPVILGVPIGAFLGSRLLVHLDNRIARGIFLGILVVLGLEMALHGLRKF